MLQCAHLHTAVSLDVDQFSSLRRTRRLQCYRLAVDGTSAKSYDFAQWHLFQLVNNVHDPVSPLYSPVGVCNNNPQNTSQNTTTGTIHTTYATITTSGCPNLNPTQIREPQYGIRPYRSGRVWLMEVFPMALKQALQQGEAARGKHREVDVLRRQRFCNAEAVADGQRRRRCSRLCTYIQCFTERMGMSTKSKREGT